MVYTVIGGDGSRYGPVGDETLLAWMGEGRLLPDMELDKLRIGYLKAEFDGAGFQPTTDQQRQLMEQRRAMYKEALDALKKAGANLQPIELPKFSTGSLRIILVAEAATAFGDPQSESFYDPDHSDTEDRFLLRGYSALGRLLVISYTEREVTIRLISARRATPRERKQHAQGG